MWVKHDQNIVQPVEVCVRRLPGRGADIGDGGDGGCAVESQAGGPSEREGGVGELAEDVR